MSSDDTLPAYLWTLQIAPIVPKGLIVLAKGVLNEVPERTKIGKILLAVEVSIILAGLTALSPVLGILLAESLVLSVLFFAGRVVFQILDWCDGRVQESQAAFLDAAAPLVVRFVKWYRENAYKENGEYSA